MYFANNPADSRFCETVIQTFLKSSATSPGLRMHALVDAAFDEAGFAQLVKAVKAPTVPMYADTVYSGGLEFGPQLLTLNTTSAKAAQEQIKQLLTLRGNRPMLSLWITEFEAAALAAQWQPFVSAQLEDGTAYMLRYADTRVLHSLMGVLSPQQSAHLIPGPTRVWMPARDGKFVAAENRGEGRHTPISQLLLDNTQFKAMMDNAEPDAIIDCMTNDCSSAYATTTGADLHTFVSAQIKRANTYRITQTPDLVTYCELAWSMGPEFDQDAEVLDALLRITPSRRLSDVLALVPVQTWTRLEQKHKRTLEVALT